MTVLTVEQARRMAPEAFGIGAPPSRCELCLEPWRSEQAATRTPYGPFVLWCCWPCSVKVAKGTKKRAGGER